VETEGETAMTTISESGVQRSQQRNIQIRVKGGQAMRIFSHKGRKYLVDFADFLINSQEWDENFAEGMAVKVDIPDGLTAAHWEVIHFIRNHFAQYGVCPVVYQTCRECSLKLKDLRALFPAGYQRGACKLAGLTYREGFLGYSEMPEGTAELEISGTERTYEVDARGFLTDPSAWDRTYAVFKAHELKMPGKLTEKHWQIIDFMRNYWEEHQIVPTVYDTCEANHLEIEELERFFPDGYHRGAVKIAGLRFR
jgi:tRNA 2-thiouridine synthesizing protein E